jgi:uroporphyrinogen-III decarboxylase
MNRRLYLDLAAQGLRMPIGADLVLHEQPDPEAVVLDPTLLGQVMQQAAERYRTPLAMPLMDLRIDKADLLGNLGLEGQHADTYHFSTPPAAADVERLRSRMDAPFNRRSQAHIGSIRYIAESTNLVPVGMAIGPFSLMTKLMADPITPIALAGRGLTGEDDPSILLAERCLELASAALERSLKAQIQAGARAMLICEPAANVIYLSPKQIESGSDIFERFVMQPDLRIRNQLEAAGVDLIFHDCGELNDAMVRAFAERLNPTVLSLGSSRRLWEDARLTPDHIVLYGNLPTKSFYSDAAMPAEKVRAMTRELVENMRAAGHPHILGSECDVLHVPDAAATIRRKVDVMLSA